VYFYTPLLSPHLYWQEKNRFYRILVAIRTHSLTDAGVIGGLSVHGLCREGAPIGTEVEWYTMRKQIFCPGPTRAAKAEHKFLVSRGAQGTNQGRTPSYVLHECPLASVSTVSRDHPSLVSLWLTFLKHAPYWNKCRFFYPNRWNRFFVLFLCEYRYGIHWKLFSLFIAVNVIAFL
jgi:hypothetical protein